MFKTMSKKNIKLYYEFESKKDDASDLSKFAIMQPNRRVREDGELFFASETSRFAKAGILPRAAWNTILSNGGGTISDSDREQYGKLLSQYREKSFDLQSLLIKGQSARSESENKKIDDLLVEIDDIKKQIQSFESDQINIFENTAEAKARNRTILWWVLQLSYKKVDNEYVPYFGGESFNDKLDSYDELEETGESFVLDTIRRFTYLITLWFLGSIEKSEDFALIDSDYMSSKTIDKKDDEVKDAESTKDGSDSSENAEAPSE